MARNLRRLREERGWSRAEASRRCNVAIETIRRYEEQRAGEELAGLLGHPRREQDEALANTLFAAYRQRHGLGEEEAAQEEPGEG